MGKVRVALTTGCVVLALAGLSVGASARSAAASASTVSTVPGSYVSVASTRLLDTRTGTGAAAHAVGPNGTVVLQVQGRGPVPASGVGAVALNLTVTQPTRDGVVTAYPDGSTPPSTSNLNYTAGQTIANLVVVAVGSDGKIDLHVTSGGSTQLIADVSGYYRSGTSVDAGTFAPVVSTRLLDTRTGTGAPAQAVSPNGTVVLQVEGRGPVPASGVGAVALNLTVTQATSAGVVTAYPDGSPPPGTSNVNYNAGQTIANLVVVAVGSDGKIDLQVSSGGTTQLIADVSGYYLSGTPVDAGSLAPVVATRSLDTRTGIGAPAHAVGPNGTVVLPVDGRGPIPASGVGAVVLNLTVTQPTSSGFVSAYPDGHSTPGTSNLDYIAGQTIANLVMVAVGSDGKIDLHVASAGTTQLIADVIGYYRSDTVPGLAWSAPSVIDPPTGHPGSISCPTAAFCAAVDGGNVFLRRSGQWGLSTYLDQHDLQAVSCTSAIFCEATAVEGQVYTFDGSSWSLQTTVPAVSFLQDLVCVSATFCLTVAVEQNSSERVDTYTFNGTTWASTAPGPTAIWSLSCATATFCVAVGGGGVASTFRGSTWDSGVVIDSSSPGPGLTAVSCPTTTFCAAFDVDGRVLTYDGAGWTSPTMVDSGHSPIFVSCVSATFCAAFDSDGQALTYNGSAWSAPSFVSVSGSGVRPAGLSCASSSYCVATIDAGYSITYDGANWTQQFFDRTTGDITAISCPTTSDCVAVDGWGNALTYNGSTWSRPNAVDAATGLAALSCPTTTFCAAVSFSYTAGTATYTYNGSTWTPGPVIPSERLSSVSCPSSNFCVAVGWSGNAILYRNGQWGSPTTIDATGQPQAVSCPTSTFCVAVGSGNVVTYDGTNWATPINLDSYPGLDAVSCPLTTFCLAGDGNGNVFTYDGGTWSAPQSVTNQEIANITCSSPSACVADTQYTALSFDGTTWSPPRSGNPDTGAPLALTCPTPTVCALAGGELIFWSH